jgi:hypothetical protein
MVIGTNVYVMVLSEGSEGMGRGGWEVTDNDKIHVAS